MFNTQLGTYGFRFSSMYNSQGQNPRLGPPGQGLALKPNPKVGAAPKFT